MKRASSDHGEVWQGGSALVLVVMLLSLLVFIPLGVQLLKLSHHQARRPVPALAHVPESAALAALPPESAVSAGGLDVPLAQTVAPVQKAEIAPLFFLENRLYYPHEISKIDPGKAAPIGPAGTDFRDDALRAAGPGLSLHPKAAVLITRRADGSVGSGALVQGGPAAAGVAWAVDQGGTGSWSGGLRTTGRPDTLSAGEATLSVERVFGVSSDDLALAADLRLSSAADLPAPGPSDVLIFIDGDAVLDSASALERTGGVLVVRGNLKVPAGAGLRFRGVIHVSGDAEIQGGADIAGCLVVQGSLALSSSGGRTVSIVYDQAAVEAAARAASRAAARRASGRPS